MGLSSLAAKCGGLVELDLSNATELRDSGAAAVAEAKNLEKLWLARCRLVSDIGIGCIAVGCKKLKLLSLRWCVRVTDLGVGLIANKCRELRALDLSYLPVKSSFLLLLRSFLLKKEKKGVCAVLELVMVILVLGIICRLDITKRKERRQTLFSCS